MTEKQNKQLTKEQLRELNESAMNLIMKTFGLEHPSVIWFCQEIEKNPYINVNERARLIVEAFEEHSENEDEDF